MRASSSRQVCSTSNARSVDRHEAAVHLHHERFELVAQIAHRDDAGHAGATLQGVHGALQLRTQVGAFGLGAPGDERLFRDIDQLGGFFGEDGGDFGVVVGVVDGLAVVDVFFGYVRQQRLR